MNEKITDKIKENAEVEVLDEAIKMLSMAASKQKLNSMGYFLATVIIAMQCADDKEVLYKTKFNLETIAKAIEESKEILNDALALLDKKIRGEK